MTRSRCPWSRSNNSHTARASRFRHQGHNFSDLETFRGNVALLPTPGLDRMQQILTVRGYYHDKIDGKAGMKTRAALGAYQKSAGLKVDCWPSEAVLRSISAAR